MPLALCCMSHSPLLNLPGPSQDLLDDIDGALAPGAGFRHGLRPRTRRHLLAGPLQRLLLQADAAVLHRHTRHKASATTAPTRGRSTCPRQSRPTARRRFSSAGIDVAISASMDVDHGTVQPLREVVRHATARPVIPIFINSVATPLGPLHRVPALGAAVGTYLATLDKRVLVVGSGGLSHDPPVPTLATAPPRGDRTDRARPTDDTRATAGAPDRGDGRRQELRRWARATCSRSTRTGISNSSRSSTAGDSTNSTRWSNAFIADEGGNSAHEIRTWVAAFAALAAAGPYQTGVRYYKPAPELIAGFAIRTAVPA